MGGCRFKRCKNDFGSARLPNSGLGGLHQMLIRVVVGGTVQVEGAVQVDAVEDEVGLIVRGTVQDLVEALGTHEMTMTTMKVRVEKILVRLPLAGLSKLNDTWRGF